ncbi:MAG TPA: hypothetical protein VN666_11005 [Nitrospira sp.]|nr:hypothetical protein [Nitrospira sp.]
MKLRAGDLVEVKSKDEILATLDEQGALDQLPFMLEMLQYCGKQLKVFKRVHECTRLATRLNIRDRDG